MNMNNKGQLMIVAGLFILLILIFSYSLETDNTYIVKKGKYNLLENIMHETCLVGTLSNGTYIESRFSSFENDIESYCSSIGVTCDLMITNNTVIPANNSLVNYSLYDYEISFEDSGFNYQINFTCP